MASPPALLIDTSSLLRAELDRFDFANDQHVSAVIECLVLFDKILLDGPSVERNRESLQWLSDIGTGIEILDISAQEETALYQSTEVLARRISPSPGNQYFLPGHMPRELGREISQRGFPPSTSWEDLRRYLESEDLRRLQRVFDEVLGPNAPVNGRTFVALARALYYLCLQEATGSSLLLDPSKQLWSNPPEMIGYARSILGLFDQEVVEAFRERKRRWLGERPRKIRLPLLQNFVYVDAERYGWSVGTAIASMRESREAELFRDGLNELQGALDRHESNSVDSVFSDLDAAAAAWSKRLGVGYRYTEVSVSVSIPFASITKNLSLPHFPRRSTSDKLLIFIGKLLSHVD